MLIYSSDADSRSICSSGCALFIFLPCDACSKKLGYVPEQDEELELIRPSFQVAILTCKDSGQGCKVSGVSAAFAGSAR